MAILTIYWSLDLALVFWSTFMAVYFYMTRNFNYWHRRGVTELPPIPFFGNFFGCCLFQVSISKHVESFYRRGEGLPYVGIYVFDKPALLLRDPDIIKNVLIKDFHCFSDRYATAHESDALGAGNIFLLKNPHWRIVRNKTSSIFSSSKVKSMYPLMSAIGENLITHLEALKLSADGGVVQIKDLTTKYTIDVVTTCAFGLQADCLNDPQSAFKKCGTNIFGFTTYKRGFEFSAFFFAPILVKLLKMRFFSEESSDFMRKIFHETMDMRRRSETNRNDLIDLLIQLQDSQVKNDEPDAFKLEGDNLVAQAATFFAAGFETTATTMAYSLYELALHPKIQSKIRDELITAITDNEGELTFEMVMSLPYLDMAVSETLRKYPSLPILDRVAVCDYTIPGTDIVIEKGTGVYISLFGLHYDPEHFPDPEKYNPERFSNENKKEIRSCTYLPFGEGPHNCIGRRFGLLVAKLGIVKILLNYELSACDQTAIPIRYDPKALSALPEGGIFLNLQKISPPTLS